MNSRYLWSAFAASIALLLFIFPAHALTQPQVQGKTQELADAKAALAQAQADARKPTNCSSLSGIARMVCNRVETAERNKHVTDAQNRVLKLQAEQKSQVAEATQTPKASGQAVDAPLGAQTSAPQTCNGVEATLLSLYRTGPGDATADFSVRNIKNDDMAMMLYYGGANGRNTFLIDDSGTEWPKKRVDGNGNHRRALMAGVNTKFSLVFHVAMGGQDARLFQVVLWPQLLPLSGMGELGFCKFQFSNVPLSAPPTPQIVVADADTTSRAAPASVALAPQAAVTRAPNTQANRPTPVLNAPPTQTARTTPAAPTNPDIYDSKSFSGLTTWLDAFQKEAGNPTDFAANLAKINAAANGSQAKGMVLVGGARRNDLQKFLTDHELYKGYYRSASALVKLQNQCLVQRDYSAAETCDCVAGFPGDTSIGPGAGELVVQSNKTKAIAACGRAAELATDPLQKARFTAQRARAQAKTMDAEQAGKWADEAIAGGYRRATIVKASAALQGVEELSGGFPVTKAMVNEQVKYGVEYLKSAKKAGVWETHIVAQQFQEVMNNIAFNDAILEPMVKSMLAPPPSGPCRLGFRYEGVSLGGETRCVRD